MNGSRRSWLLNFLKSSDPLSRLSVKTVIAAGEAAATGVKKKVEQVFKLGSVS